MAEFAILFDTTRCVGCKACQAACKEWNELQGEATQLAESFTNPVTLSGNTWLTMRFTEEGAGDTFRWHFTRISCMHCAQPACAAICPVKAITKHPEGPVTIDQEACIGCGFCVEACPWTVPKLRSASEPKAFKCTMCADRIAGNAKPACVEACPFAALEFGARAELLTRAKARAAQVGGIVYGEKEVGGASVLYVLPTAPGRVGLPELPETLAPAVTFANLSRWATPLAEGTGIVVLGLGLVNWARRRREEVAEAVEARKP